MYLNQCIYIRHMPIKQLTFLLWCLYAGKSTPGQTFGTRWPVRLRSKGEHSVTSTHGYIKTADWCSALEVVATWMQCIKWWILIIAHCIGWSWRNRCCGTKGRTKRPCEHWISYTRCLGGEKYHRLLYYTENAVSCMPCTALLITWSQDE